MTVQSIPGPEAYCVIYSLVERGRFEEALAKIRELPPDYASEELVSLGGEDCSGLRPAGRS